MSALLELIVSMISKSHT